jgi:hypothetical protein
VISLCVAPLRSNAWLTYYSIYAWDSLVAIRVAQANFLNIDCYVAKDGVKVHRFRTAAQNEKV